MLSSRSKSSALAVVAAVVIAACGGSGGDDTASPPAGEPVDEGDAAATAELVSSDLVWVTDGEPVGPTFDYTEPIDRARFGAGMRLEVEFVTNGDLGSRVVELFVPVTINDDKIDAGATMGPEESMTRPPRDSIEIIDTADGFVAQIDIGMPLSPVSLVDRREDAVEFGLNPDAERETVGDDDFAFEINVAGLLDIPAAPVGGRNVVEYGLRGSIMFGNGVEVEVDEQARVTVVEEQTVELGRGEACADLAGNYLDLVAAEVAAADLILLDRVRAFDVLSDRARDGDCSPAGFSVPVCAGAEAARDDGAPASLIERHLDECPTPEQQVELTVFEPRFVDGVVHLVVPRTLDGLPAYSVAMSFPDWEVDTTSLTSRGQKIRLNLPGNRLISLDVDTSLMPPTLMDDRMADATTPESPDATEIVSDTTTIAERNASRLISLANVDESFNEFQIGTAIAIDEERLLTITGFPGGRVEEVDADRVIELMACIESSIVVEEFVDANTLAPAADCSEVGSFEAVAAAEPAVDDVDPGEEPIDDQPVSDEPVDDEPATTEPPVEEVVVDIPADSSFDSGVVTLVVPAIRDERAHVVTLPAPPWALERIDDSSANQVVELVGPELFDGLVVAARLIGDKDERLDEYVAPPDDWTVVYDEPIEVSGRAFRMVIREKTISGGGVLSVANVVGRIDAERALDVELRVDANSAVDVDIEIATIAASLSILP